MEDQTPLTETELRQRIVEALKACYDPEIPVDIWELGLIYGIEIDIEKKRVDIIMTLTSPGCPAAQSLPAEVKDRLLAVEGVLDGDVEVVWEPPYDPSMMSEEARLTLGFM